MHTKKEAVNLAMRDYVEQFRRIEALARSREQAQGWDYEGVFRAVYPDVPVPKSVWRWTDLAQHSLAGAGAVRALSVVGLLICGTAAASDLVVLHDDADYELAERRLPDVRAQRIVKTDV